MVISAKKSFISRKRNYEEHLTSNLNDNTDLDWYYQQFNRTNNAKKRKLTHEVNYLTKKIKIQNIQNNIINIQHIHNYHNFETKKHISPIKIIKSPSLTFKQNIEIINLYLSLS